MILPIIMFENNKEYKTIFGDCYKFKNIVDCYE